MIITNNVINVNAMWIANRLTQNAETDIQGFLDEFVHKWFLRCQREEDEAQQRKLYLVARFVRELVQKKP